MKRKLVCLTLIIVLIISAIGLSGCSSKPESSTGEPDTNQKSEKKHALMGTSGISGTTYPACAKIAGLVMNKTDSLVTIQATGGSTENIRLMKIGDLDMGICSSTVLPDAFNGTGAFDGDPYSDVRFVVALFPQVLQAVVHKNSPINSYNDLKGKAISPGAPGSGDLTDWETVLKYYGIAKSDVDWRPLSHTERAIGFKDNTLQCIAYSSPCPAGTILEASSQSPVRLLSIDGKEKEQILNECPWYAPYTIPAGTYNGEDRDIETISNLSLVVADAKVSDDLIYDYVKAIYENLDQVQEVHPMAKEIRLETALYGKGDVMIHPGAEKYYKEVGIIK